MVQGFEKYDVTGDGDIIGASKKRLNPWVGRGGYLKVCLYNKGKRRWAYVHRLVCEVYHGLPLEGQEVNHKDGNKMNNSSGNLEWVTRSENNFHAFRTGLRYQKRGEGHYNHKLTGSDVDLIRGLRGVKTQRELEKMFGVSHSHVSKIQRNINWVQGVDNV
jgi:hypothetical protein